MRQVENKSPSKPSTQDRGLVDMALLIALGARLRDVKKGEVIFQEGGHCRYYHQLVKGSVRWVNVDDAGREFMQSLIEPNESFGELPLFDNKPYAASAIANEDSVIVRLKKESFLQLIKEDHHIHLMIDRKMTERLRFKFLLLKTQAHHSPEFRIRELLDFLKAEKKHICPECHQIKLTRQQIADLSGLRVETVIRVIRRMHEEGQLLIENRKIFYA